MKNLYILFLVLTYFIRPAQNMKTFTYATKGLDTLKLDVYTPENIKHVGQSAREPLKG